MPGAALAAGAEGKLLGRSSYRAIKRLTEPARIYTQHFGATKDAGLAAAQLKFDEVKKALIDICPVKRSSWVERPGSVIGANGL